jgi:hypothetical protein
MERLSAQGKMRLGDLSKIDDSKYSHVMRPLLIKKPVNDPIIVGFDSEWNAETGELLSVQFATENLAKVYYTHKLNAKTLFNHVLKFLKAAQITRCARGKIRIYLICHFAQADISKISDYLSDFKLRVFNKAMSAEMIFADRDEFENEIHQKSSFRKGKYSVKILDLYGYFSQSLASIGDLVGLPKLEENRGKLHILLKQDRRRYEAYAKRDAEICVRAFCLLRRIFQEKFGIEILFYPTIAGLAAAVFRTHYLKEPIVPYQIVGKIRKTRTKKDVWKEHVVKETVFAGDLNARRLSLLAYWGGRAECYGRGLLHASLEYYDVVSLYPSSTLLQSLPNKDTVWIKFDSWTEAKELEGFCRVQFEFSKNQNYPCLPVMPFWATKLYFPLKGESYCTLAEVRTAVKLGARITAIDGFGFRPTPNERNHVLGLFMKAFMQLKKNERENTLMYETWKLVINSTIGKFCQRTHEYDVSEMLTYMKKTGMSNLADYDVYKNLKHSQSVGGCWSPEWAALILGKARSLIGELVARGSLLCSTDSGLFPKDTPLECDALKELRSVGSDFVKKHEGDAALLIRARMYAVFQNGKIVKDAKHGTLASKDEFSKIVAENLEAKNDLKQQIRKTHLAGLKDVVRKGSKLNVEEILERTIKWDWDGKRTLKSPNANLWCEWSDSEPLGELAEFPKKPARSRAFGRPAVLTKEQEAEIKRLRQKGATIRKLAENFHVGLATIQRVIRK